MLKPKLRRLLDRLFLIPALVLVIGPVQTAAAAVMGDHFVSGAGNDTTGDGSQANPWRTITKAALRARLAGDSDINIYVGPGTYDAAAGEEFPITMDELVLPVGEPASRSFTVTGPGDGSATVNTAGTEGKLGGGGGGPTLNSFLQAFNRITGEVSLSGLTIEGEEASGALLGGGGPSAVSLYQGANTVTLQNNEISGLGLITDYDNEYVGCSILLENNTVVDYPYSVMAISCYPSTSYWASSSTATVDRDITIRGNTFISDNDRNVGYAYGGLGGLGATGHLSLLVEDNTFRGCGDFSVGVSAFMEGEITFDAVISGNEGFDCDDGIAFGGYVYSRGAVNGSVDVQDNSFSMLDGIGIRGNLWVSDGGAMDVDFTIEDNNVVGGDRGLYFSCTGSSLTSSNVSVRDVAITNNHFSSMLYDGAEVYMGNYGEGFQGENSVLIDGNTIRSCGEDGLVLNLYATGSASNTYDVALTRNDISFNGGGSDHQVEAMFSAYTSMACSVTLDMRGNVIRNVSPSDRLLEMQAYASTTGSLLNLQVGGLGHGYNTISPSSSAASNSLALNVSAALAPDLNLMGNWWGTTDSAEVESFVYHGVDASSYAVADLSPLLPDDLMFDVSQVGDKIELTAAPLAGFVAYAGDLTIDVTVDGVAANNVTVASDYRSLTFDNDYSGAVEICVTNPGGQSGCDTVTVSASSGDSGGGGGGCGVIPVDGGPPSVKEFFGQYFLLLLPALFLLRRRMRGVRPQPVGYAA